MKKLTCLLVLSLSFLKAATLQTFTVEQFQYLLNAAVQPVPNNDTLNGKTRAAKALGITPFLKRTVFGEANPIVKRYTIVQALLLRAPVDADFSCLEAQTCPLEATMAFMSHLSAQTLRPRLNQTLATRFPGGTVNNPSAMFMQDPDEAKLEKARPFYDFYKWYSVTLTYHVLFQLDTHLALRGSVALSNAQAYLQFLGDRENKQAFYAERSLPILQLARNMYPDFLMIYFQLHQCYKIMLNLTEADRWYKEGNSRSLLKHGKELRNYLLGSSKIVTGKSEHQTLNFEDAGEVLIIARNLLQKDDLGDKVRLNFLGTVIKFSTDEEEKRQALGEINAILTPDFLGQILKGQQLHFLQNILSFKNKTYSAYVDLRRKVTQAVIQLDDKQLAMSLAKKLDLEEALDTVSTSFSLDFGMPTGMPVCVLDADDLSGDPTNGLLVLLQAMMTPANALSCEELAGQGLKVLCNRLEELKKAGLKEGDPAYDNTVSEIRAKEAELYNRSQETQRIAKQEFDRFWAQPAAAAAACGAPKIRRKGPAVCAASCVEELPSSSNDDEAAFDSQAALTEATRLATASEYILPEGRVFELSVGAASGGSGTLQVLYEIVGDDRIELARFRPHTHYDFDAAKSKAILWQFYLLQEKYRGAAQ